MKPCTFVRSSISTGTADLRRQLWKIGSVQDDATEERSSCPMGGRLEGCAARKAEELGLVGGALGDGLGEVKPDWPERRSPDDRAARGCAHCAPVAADPNAIALGEVQRRELVSGSNRS